MTTTKHTKSVHVDAPVETVFDYVKDPEHFFGAMPPREHFELREVTMAPDGIGTTYEWAGRELGLRLSGVNTREVYVLNRRIVDWAAAGPVWTWTLEPERAGTMLTLCYEYSTHVPLMDEVVASIAWHADEDLERTVFTIKERVEA